MFLIKYYCSIAWLV